MAWLLLRRAWLLCSYAGLQLAHAQYPPPPTYERVVKSPADPNVVVRYKQPSLGTCTTYNASQKQYTGYIEIPPYTLAPIQQNYSINTFFWFIESRDPPGTAPLTVWLNGGPGTSSMFGLFNEVGPCEVVQLPDGTYGTQMRAFGWDRASNLLFIDQPNQVGFSYDTANNASFNLLSNAVFEPPTSPNPNLPDFMYLNGTFGTATANAPKPYASTANTTEIAAAATWHFLQTWLATFPQYNPATRSNSSVRSSVGATGINLFTESYGGRYGPVFASYFEKQNQAIKLGTISRNNTLLIRLQSLGIINGLVDSLIQDRYYPLFAFNNTYGIKAISVTDELNAISNYTNFCAPAIQACRAAGEDVYGDDAVANALCESAAYTCNALTALALQNGYYPYDIRQKIPSPDPPAAYQEYLNNASVLQSIGAQVNYTESNNYVLQGFLDSGDISRDGTITDLAELLTQGVHVALIYGDADYICNWFGGLAVASAIADALKNYSMPSPPASSGLVTPSSYSSAFAAAGFAEVVVNTSYVGGAVKQYGNLSFSRVYDAGHFVPYFQPETAFQLFARIIHGNDISLGAIADLSYFSSNGPANSTYLNSAPPAPEQTCWVRSWNSSCTPDDTAAMLGGNGLVENGIYYKDSSSIVLPTLTVAAGVPGSPITTSLVSGSTLPSGPSTTLTGAFTATTTPSPSKGTGAAASVVPPSNIYGGSIVFTMVSALFGMLLMI